MAADDCVLYTTNMSGHKIPVTVPRNSAIFLHIHGLHHNRELDVNYCCLNRFWDLAKYWVEAIAVITLFSLRSIKIKLKDEPQFAHESFEQRKARLLNHKTSLTLTPGKVPLIFERRN
ncbi:hypothetical protein BC629DRAFT_1522199 [Irpex lacteus]|nr:hypothetical protein BC629DRAFT_1522199 [Irpex lacteus]